MKGIKLTAYQDNFENHSFEKCNDQNNIPNNRYIKYFVNLDIDTIISKRKYQDSFFSIYTIDRTDPALLQVVNELKDSEQLDLKIVEVPDDVQWRIEEDEMGPECVREISRCWS